MTQFPTIKMYSSWFNIVRKDQFVYNRKERKYEYSDRGNKKKQMGDTYVAGLNTSVLQEKFVRCEFHFQRMQEDPRPGSLQRHSGKHRTE